MNIEIKNRLINCIAMSDEQCSRYISSTMKGKGYEVIADSGSNFIFCIPPPKDNSVIPVLLCAHWDTVRDSAKPVTLVVNDDDDFDVLTNDEGHLGADDRAGVQIILEAVDMYASKPYVLFTNYEESGMLGMKEFVKSDLLKPYVDNINLIISVDRRGRNQIVSASFTALSKAIEALSLKFGYVPQGGYITDSYMLEDKYLITAVNVSYGGYAPHTSKEWLSFNDWEESLVRLSKFMAGIDSKHVHEPRVWSMVHQPPKSSFSYYPDKPREPKVIIGHVPSCNICGRTDREVKFDVGVQAYICKACYNRASNDCVRITRDNIDSRRRYLELERTRTRRQNAVMNKNKGAKLPPCPVCRVNDRVAWHEATSGFVCLACVERHCEGNFDGHFWKIHNKQLKMKQLLWVQGKSVIRHNLELKGTIMSATPVDKEPLIQKCEHCNRYTRYYFEVGVTFNGRMSFKKICSTCVNELHEMQAVPPDPKDDCPFMSVEEFNKLNPDATMTIVGSEDMGGSHD